MAVQCNNVEGNGKNHAVWERVPEHTKDNRNHDSEKQQDVKAGEIERDVCPYSAEKNDNKDREDMQWNRVNNK